MKIVECLQGMWLESRVLPRFLIFVFRHLLDLLSRWYLLRRRLNWLNCSAETNLDTLFLSFLSLDKRRRVCVLVFHIFLYEWIRKRERYSDFYSRWAGFFFFPFFFPFFLILLFYSVELWFLFSFLCLLLVPAYIANDKNAVKLSFSFLFHFRCQ